MEQNIDIHTSYCHTAIRCEFFTLAMSHFVDDINFTVNIKQKYIKKWDVRLKHMSGWWKSECCFLYSRVPVCIYICLNMLKKGKWISLMNDIIRHIGNFSSWVTALSHSFARSLARSLIYIIIHFVVKRQKYMTEDIFRICFLLAHYYS